MATNKPEQSQTRGEGQGPSGGEMRLDSEQASSIGKLLNDASKDPSVRARLAGDPYTLLQEYGLDSLVAEKEVRVTIDVSAHQHGIEFEGVLAKWGFHVDANTGHVDARQHQDVTTPHADAHPHVDFPALHADWSHQDIPPLHFDI